MDAFKLILVSLAGWMNRQQQRVIESLQEEIRVLKEQRGDGRPRFTDDQRSRLTREAKLVGFGRLKEIVNLVTQQTLLAWRRRLIAGKYDSSGVRRKVGRPPPAEELRLLVIRIVEENRGLGATDFFAVEVWTLHGPVRYHVLFVIRLSNRKCLDRMLLIGEGSLRRAVDQFCEHHHCERNRQGLGNKLIGPDFGPDGRGEVQCRQRLGGQLHYYYRDAA